MYSTCIFCSSPLGRNEAIEEFPVGRSLAFDAWKGRLWAVCGKCGRWNLAPIEERWEAVEAAEKRFRDSRMRVQSENIGLAKLPDGTRLVRVGEALPGELAVWRYGRTLMGRRRQYYLGVGAVVGVAALAMGGMWAAGSIAMAGNFFNIGNLIWQQKLGRKLVYRLPGEESPTGEEMWLHRWQLQGARLSHDEAGRPALLLPEGRVPEKGREKDPEAWALTLTGKPAEAVLARAMVLANRKGAGRSDVAHALSLLEGAGSAEEYVQRALARDAALGVPRLQYAGARTTGPSYTPAQRWRHLTGSFRGEVVPIQRVPAAAMPSRGLKVQRHPLAKQLAAEEKKIRLPHPEALALEMALHEESERRALQGELELLEAAWREAEEIAAIADVLPGDPLEQLPDRSAPPEQP